MRIIQLASSKTQWRVQTWDEGDGRDDDCVFFVSIGRDLSGKDLAEALSAAADAHEGIKDPAEILSWDEESDGAMRIRCGLGDGRVGVMRCTRAGRGSP